MHREGDYGHTPIYNRFREYLGINQAKEMREIYNENFKFMQKETDIRKWRDTIAHGLLA